MKKIIGILQILAMLVLLTACGQSQTNDTVAEDDSPIQIELIPDEYRLPAEHTGTLCRLSYRTWESFSYNDHSRELTKNVWVYLPYGYDPAQKYNIFYLSHGGWSDETTLMGTDTDPSSLKNVIDHAMEDGKIQPMILAMVTFNNTDRNDSWDYNLSIKLTDQFHNELINDIIPTVESKYSTYAVDTTKEELIASRDHRGFGGFSLGSVNTWCTFRYALDYFRYFMPISGKYEVDDTYIAKMVTDQGYTATDFFIFAMSSPDDFTYSGIKSQIESMATDEMFTYGESEDEGNLMWREIAGFQHGPEASDLFIYNGLRFFWND